LVAKKVSDLQEAFRNSVVTGQVTIGSPSSAYYAIQSYYHICLPHSIEGVMLQSIADSKPVTPASETNVVAVTSVRSARSATIVRGDSRASSAIRTPELR
jgi:hypothetical protein